MTCGNKTDPCPNCRQFIRRAVFAYHYENNCANVEEADTPTPRSKNSSSHRSSSKSKKLALGENDVNDHEQKKTSGYHSSNDRSKTLDRTSSTKSTKS